MAAAGSRRLGAAARDTDWQACTDHELDEEFNRELVDVAIHDLANCRLRNFEGVSSLPSMMRELAGIALPANLFQFRYGDRFIAN
jgi:hypothetical protein